MKRIFLILLTLLATVSPGFSVPEKRFQNGDVFEMRLSGPPEEFTREFNLVLTVDEGSVNLPLIGRVPAVGLSSTQLASTIEQRLKQAKIFTVANVNITVNQAPSNQRTIIVGGSVRQSGRQPWTEDLTLSGAISSAGGPSDFAKDTVKLVRGGKAQFYSRKAIRKDPGSDPKILQGDIIEVEGD